MSLSSTFPFGHVGAHSSDRLHGSKRWQLPAQGWHTLPAGAVARRTQQALEQEVKGTSVSSYPDVAM